MLGHYARKCGNVPAPFFSLAPTNGNGNAYVPSSNRLTRSHGLQPFDRTFFDVHWYGPFSYDQLDELHNDPNLVLYMVSGTHGVYGHNVPLYLDMTEQGIRDRLLQHKAWLQDESDPPMVYAAAVSEMKSWADIEQKEAYPPPPRDVIEETESLLIYAHQLAYKVKSKKGGNRHRRDLLVFNTGKRSGLYPEVSTMNWYGDIEIRNQFS